MQDATDVRLGSVDGVVGSTILTRTLGFPQSSFSSDYQCVHFWVIETPNGPTSQGTCQICGRVQLFRNSVSSTTWNRGVGRREIGWM